jgi:para-nitrobenzyl esterase
MMSYWARFAATGAPDKGTGGDLPEWKPWSARDPQKFIVFDTEADGGTRMVEAEPLTVDAVIASVDADTRLEEPRERCEIFRRLALRNRGIGPDDYPEIGESGCLRYPLAAWPWVD